MRKKGKFNKIGSFFIFKLLLVLVVIGCENNNEPSVTPSAVGVSAAIFNATVNYGEMTDQEGNTYKTVTIGTQTWMAENLRTTQYADGTAIPNVKGDDEWVALTTGGYCNYNNITDNDTTIIFGRLYNWYAVNTGKLAPDGWHIATDAEWTQLTTYLGEGDNIATELKEVGTTHWLTANEGATNLSGFTALPAGYRSYNGIFSSMGNFGHWWSATDYLANTAWQRTMLSVLNEVRRDEGSKILGFSVRCVKD